MALMRDIIEIDEELCNGCGNCVADCAEGAIAIVNGKAKVVSDSFCDGLGACIGRCPTDALRIIQRKAPPFDEAAAMAHVAAQGSAAAAPVAHACGCAGHDGMPGAINHPRPMPIGGGCLGSMASAGPGAAPWPIKIRLISPDAPFLRGADLLIAADCAAPVTPRFQEYAKGKAVLIACPKFEDSEALMTKLSMIFQQAGLKSCTVMRMEVPCCGGLVQAVRMVYAKSGAKFPLREMVLGRDGREL